jgi:hypothetical protein
MEWSSEDVLVAVTVRTETMLPAVTVVGEKEQVTLAGWPEHANEMEALVGRPSCGVTVIVSVPLAPAVTDRDGEDKVSKKLGVAVVALASFEAADVPFVSVASTR